MHHLHNVDDNNSHVP